MIIMQKALPRRTFLRGVGATLALPFLDAMVPAASSAARAVSAPARRLGFIYVPNGVIQERWVPAQTGRGFDFSPILSPLEPFRDQVLVLSGLAHRQADSFGDGNGDHPRATAVWLSGVHAWERRGRQGPTAIKLGTTADQIAAREFGKETPLPSLELALEQPTAIACDTGDCFYSNTISWRNETTPLDMEAHPRVVFERLFGEGGSAADRLAVVRQTGSILDSVTAEVARLGGTLGPSDRNKLDEYLDAVRDIEQRVQRSESRGDESFVELPERPVDIPEEFEDHAKLMFDLQVLAFQADVTRVFTLMMAREASPRPYPADRGAGSAPHGVASPQRPRVHRQEVEDRHVSHPGAHLSARQAARDAGRRRQPSGSLDDRLRRRHRERQPPRAHEPAVPRGGRRAADGCAAGGTAPMRRTRRMRTCC